jgi:CRISPR-associated protein Cas5d
MKTNNRITLRVWGDYACFTRPEMKVERVSYPVMTPSAARGILEAIFWEPQMFYLIDAIRVVKKGRWFSFRRNEVIKVISLDSARTWMREPDKVTPIQAGGGADDGTQRNMLALQDVEYLITAEVRATPLANRPEDTLAKYLGEIERRARQGKCFHRPGLGMREFAADFDWVDGDPDAALARRAAALGQSPDQFNEDLGLMLYDVFDPRERSTGFRWLRPEECAEREREFETSLAGLKKGEQTRRRKEFAANPPRWTGQLLKPQPLFFHARVEKSKLDCHPDRVQILTPTTGGN